MEDDRNREDKYVMNVFSKINLKRFHLAEDPYPPFKEKLLCETDDTRC
jgi:hypothetical protein